MLVVKELLNMKNFSAKYFVSALFLGLCVFSGCGDDSSAPLPVAPNAGAVSSSSESQPPINPPENNLSSSDVVLSSEAASSATSSPETNVPTSSSDAVILSSSTVAPPPMSQGLYSFAITPGALALTADADGFYDMGDVYKAVPKTSKIAFLIRHSKREKNNLGTESSLTPIGIQMAQTLGTKLASDESFYYSSTNFLRTRATCEYIAAGRGETGVEVATWDGINGSYFLTVPSDTLDALVSNKGGNPKYIALYSYGVPFEGKVPAAVAAVVPTYFHDFYPRGNQFVNEVIVANMPNWKRVSILVSHDMLVEPLVAFASNRTINLKVFEAPYRWVNYLSGIAVIVDEAGAVTVLPVRGDEVGRMVPKDEVDESV